ncbi:MAG: hypothetical protein HY645_15570 [Acidobacteria bacterium]|nr:hypothetical protein [Acidobacteriota bacterium]
MTFKHENSQVVARHNLQELKLIYRVLHQHLAEHIELMDTDFLLQLQMFLQGQAREEGIDASDHSLWDRWLGNEAVPCESRVRRRYGLRRK